MKHRIGSIVEFASIREIKENKLNEKQHKESEELQLFAPSANPFSLTFLWSDQKRVATTVSPLSQMHRRTNVNECHPIFSLF